MEHRSAGITAFRLGIGFLTRFPAGRFGTIQADVWQWFPGTFPAVGYLLGVCAFIPVSAIAFGLGVTGGIRGLLLGALAQVAVEGGMAAPGWRC